MEDDLYSYWHVRALLRRVSEPERQAHRNFVVGLYLDEPNNADEARDQVDAYIKHYIPGAVILGLDNIYPHKVMTAPPHGESWWGNPIWRLRKTVG